MYIRRVRLGRSSITRGYTYLHGEVRRSRRRGTGTSSPVLFVVLRRASETATMGLGPFRCSGLQRKCSSGSAERPRASRFRGFRARRQGNRNGPLGAESDRLFGGKRDRRGAVPLSRSTANSSIYRMVVAVVVRWFEGLETVSLGSKARGNAGD